MCEFFFSNYKHRTRHEGHATVATQVLLIPIAIIWKFLKHCLPKEFKVKLKIVCVEWRHIHMIACTNFAFMFNCIFSRRLKKKLPFIVLTYNSLSRTINLHIHWRNVQIEAKKNSENFWYFIVTYYSICKLKSQYNLFMVSFPLHLNVYSMFKLS